MRCVVGLAMWMRGTTLSSCYYYFMRWLLIRRDATRGPHYETMYFICIFWIDEIRPKQGRRV